jgi:hypothetical protein
MKNFRIRQTFRIVLLSVFVFTCFLAEKAKAQNFSNGFNFYLPPKDTGSTRFIPQFPRVPLTDQDFVSIDQDGHFSVRGKPIRFFGVALGGSSLFPPNADQWFIVGRIRKMGFNLVRLGSLDNPWEGPWDYPISLFPYQSTTRQINPVTLDIVENLISELKNNGIHVDIPLYMSREFNKNGLDGVPDADSLQYPSFGNGMSFFDPLVLALNKEYARQLLTHVNPYTGKSLANDPVISTIEIINEKSLYRNWCDGQLKHFSAGGALTYRHTKMLDSLWVSFLKAKYNSTSALKNAWSQGTVSPGDLVVNGSFENDPSMNGWALDVYAPTNASVGRDPVEKSSGLYSAKVVVSQADVADWKVQLAQTGLSLIKDAPYVVSFKAKSDNSRSVNAGLLREVGGKQTGYGGTTVLLTQEWKTYSFSIRSSESADGVRLYFVVGGQAGTYWFDDISINTGVAGLLSDESLETPFVRRIDYTECTFFTEQRVKDMSSFYIKLQDDYYAQMHSFLKDTLHVKVPIVGTNINIGPADMVVQSKLDYVDNHSYWDDRQFTSASQTTDWYITNTPMVNSEGGGTIGQSMCAVPAKGKPYMISEYNHTFPNRYLSEEMLFIIAYSSFHDVGGFMFHCYRGYSENNGYGDHWENDRIFDFFNIHRNSALMALMPSCALAYRTGMISKARQTLLIDYAPDDYLLLPRNNFGRWWETVFMDKKLALTYAVRTNSFTSSVPFNASSLPPLPTNPYVTDTKEITWNTDGLLSVASNKFVGATGFLNNFINQSIGPLTIKSASGFGTFTWISLTSDSLQRTLRSLLTISTRAQNTGMIWDGTTTVHDHWGTSPTTIEPLVLSLQLSIQADSIRIYPLDTIGRETRGFATYLPSPANTFTINIDQSVSRSMWFGIEKFKDNIMPFLNFRLPASQDTASRNISHTFSVSVTAPTGDQVTYVWKVNNTVMKSGPDSSYTTTFSDPVNTPKSVSVIFSIPSGLKDSTTWNLTIITGVAEKQLIPKEFSLAQNYPNPFNPSTTIKYDLPVTSRVVLRVYDVLGRVVLTLVDGIIPAGYHEVVVNSDKLSSGIYFYRIEAGSFRETKKLVLAR